MGDAALNKLQEFYKSKEWERFRNVVIQMETDPETGFVYCAHCGKPILKKYDLIVHHINELNESNVNDALITLNPENVVCVHFRCHNEIHQRFGFGTSGYKPQPKKVFIVYGSPCAGKTSYVRNNATSNDLVVDIDSIYEMISINDRYIKSDRLKSTVFDLRDHLYDVIKYRNGKWQNAFVITGGALRSERERLMNRIVADDFIFIDTSKDECLLRARERGENWEAYVLDWFEKFQK